MKLRRLRVENFRGIRQRQVEFPDSGLIVLAGPNESGKTSLVEAIDVVLRTASGSKKQQILALQPVGSDEPVLIELEFSVDDDTIKISKQYVKRPKAELTYTAGPRAGEKLTGGEANAEIDRIWARVDEVLWSALRQTQAGGLAMAKMADSSVLSQALGGTESADDGGMVAKIERAYLRYFTPGGKASGEWAQATTDYQSARQALEQARAALAIVARADQDLVDATHVHAEAVAAKERLEPEVARIEAETSAVTEAKQQLTQLQADGATHRAALADAEQDASERQALIEEIAESEARQQRFAPDIAAAEEQLQAAKREATMAEADWQDARSKQEDAQRLAGLARQRLDHQRTADEIERLTKQITQIEKLASEQAELQAQADATVADAELRRVEKLHTKVVAAKAALDVGRARVHVEPEPGASVHVDGEPISEQISRPITSDLVVEVPGHARISLTADDQSEARRQEAVDAERALAEALGKLGASDIAAVRASNDEHRATNRQLEAVAGRLAALTGDDSVESLVAARNEALARQKASETGATSQQASSDDDIESASLEDCQAQLEAAQVAEKRAMAAHREANSDLQRAQSAVTELQTTAQISAEQVRGLRARLAQLRQREADEEMHARCATAKEQLGAWQTQVDECQEQLASLSPERVSAQAEALERQLDGLTEQITKGAERIAEIQGELRGLGRDNLQTVADEAESEFSRAEYRFVATRRRALAAERLRFAVQHERAEAIDRYLGPLTERIEQLGRPLYGADFRVRLDRDLRIDSRFIDEWIRWDDLSSGAKEQLLIVSKLACARLVDGSLPVIFDDALGYSDPGRVRLLASIIGALAGDLQVIVLTANPDRYLAAGGDVVQV